MSTVEKLHELKTSTDRNPDISFVNEGWKKSPLLSKKKILETICTLFNYPIIAPALIQLYAKLAVEMKNNAFFDIGAWIKPSDIDIIMNFSDDPRWGLLKSSYVIRERIQYDAHSCLDFCRSSDYIVSAFNEFGKYPCLQRKLIKDIGRCIGGRNDSLFLYALIAIEPGVSDKMFECIIKATRHINLTSRSYEIKTERMKRLIGESKLRQCDFYIAFSCAVESGIDPLTVDGANKTLVEVATFFKKLYGKNDF